MMFAMCADHEEDGFGCYGRVCSANYGILARRPHSKLVFFVQYKRFLVVNQRASDFRPLLFSERRLNLP